MSDWYGLSTLISAISRPKVVNDIRKDAFLCATNSFGAIAPGEASALVNIAALRLSFPSDPVIHELSDAVAMRVDETDLHQYPSECPQFLRAAYIIESKKPDTPLFGNTSSLGGYWIDDRLYLIGVDFPDGIRVGAVRPVWDGSEIRGNEGDVIGDKAALDSWTIEAVRFSLVLALLLEAERTPIAMKSAGKKTYATRNGHSVCRVIHRIYIDRTYQRNVVKGNIVSDKSGKTLLPVYVRGFLRAQRVGEGRKQIKYIYIEGYESRRWIIPGPRKIIVS